MIVVDIILLTVSLALAVIGIIAVTNAITMPRLGRGMDGGEQLVKAAMQDSSAALISILVPLSNNMGGLADAVRRLLTQDDPAFEVLLLDDGSSNGSAEIAQSASDNPRLKILTGKPQPHGWQGKNWAYAQLAQAAQGEILVFCDVEVQWMPDALSRLRRALETTQADVYAIWPTPLTETWRERLVVPMIALAVVGYLPAFAVHNLPAGLFWPWPLFAAASGQCIVFKRAAYQAVGGHAGIKDQLVGDLALVRQVKRHGLKLRMADGAGLMTSRMYRDWPSLRDGFARSILAGHGNTAYLLISTLFHWLVFMFPWAWFLLGWMGGINFRYPIWALTLVATGVAIRALTAKVTRQRVGDAFLLPVSVVMMTLITGLALHWRWSGNSQPEERK